MQQTYLAPGPLNCLARALRIIGGRAATRLDQRRRAYFDWFDNHFRNAATSFPNASFILELG